MIPVSSPRISEDEVTLATEILRSGRLAQGYYVESFEKGFSELVDGAHCIAVNSGTSALHLSLLALGISEGDEVIVPAFTFAATANSVVLAGGKPVFVDVCAKTFNMDVSALEDSITSKTKAIMPVHLYGQAANMTKIVEIASKYNLLIIEDASQSHLALHLGRPVGSFGDAAVFSFYATKNMTTGGEGGLVVTKSDDVARKVKLLRNQGMETRYENEIVGFNLRMTELQAGIGTLQLAKLRNWTSLRRDNAALLSSLLKYVAVPHVEKDNFHVFHQYTIKVPATLRLELIKYLADRGIGSGIYYPKAIDSLPSFNNSNLKRVSQELSETVLSLPIHPNVSKEQIHMIADSVNNFFEEQK
jgi:dTDP-4-amino-4,6-dideoxygalactose transaminase